MFSAAVASVARDAALSPTLSSLALPAVTLPVKAPVGIDHPSLTNTAGAVLATMASTTTKTMLAAAATSTQGGPSGGPKENNGECSLLGPFALLVQLALGGLALLSLVYKRWRERPQRPVKIWFFDVSKQVFGSVLVHVANVFMSMLTSGRFSMQVEPASVQTVRRLMARDDPYTPNPCSFYLLNLAIDTTLGIPILILLLRAFTILLAYTPIGKPAESIQSGNYGSPPNAWWWLKQSVIYFCGLFGMKLCVLVIFLVFPWISKVGDWALRWTEGNEQLQIFFVMMFFPLIMNALQYYIIDSFIKKKDQEHEHEAVPQYDDSEIPQRHLSARRYDDPDFRNSIDSGPDSDSGSDEIVASKPQDDRVQEYDPSIDGDTPTIIGSSASRTGERGKLLPKELFPPE